MVGVAPMSGGAAPAPAAAPHAFPPTAPMAAVPMGGMGGVPPMMSPPPQGPPPGFDQPPAYAPQGGQGVNPLGGTVAADGGGFAAYAQQAAAAAAANQNPYGQPQGGAPYGAPPGAPPQYGAPPGQPGQPGQFGAPPGGAAPYGTSPNPYGGQPQQGYGAPGQPAPGYGQPNPMAPQGGMMPYGGAAAPVNAMVGTLPSTGVSSGPTRRNALMTLVLPLAVMFGGIVVSTVGGIIGIAAVGLLGSLINLGGAVWYLLFLIQMCNELKAVTGNQSFAWWPIFIPFYGLFWAIILLPQEVTKAKQLRGVQAPTRNIVLYFFLLNFALASDLNDLAR